MANYKWPNVYANIKDLSGVVATNSVTSCAYVGEAEFGPINIPTFISSLREYTSKFGALNSAKYGYAGYSLAVAAESIDSHYFVRTVKKGDPENHEPDDAMYASIKIPSAKSKVPSTGAGIYVETIEDVKKEENATSLFTEADYTTKSFKLVAAGSKYALGDELKAELDVKPLKVKVSELESEFTTIKAVVVNKGHHYINGEPLSVIFEDGIAAQFTAVVDPDDVDGKLQNVIIEDGGLSPKEILHDVPVVVNGWDDESGETGEGATLSLSMVNTGKIKAIELVEKGLSSTEEIENPINLEYTDSTEAGAGTGAKVEISAFTNLDLEDALIFVADNPNNLKISVRLTDSTINENKGYSFDALKYVLKEDRIYTATVENVNKNVLEGLQVGDKVAISRVVKDAQNGVFELTAIDLDAKTVSYEYNASAEELPENVSFGKIAKYPAPNERTFQVDVYVTKGKLIQNVETYQYCTLYPAKDNYGNSMYIEDVINGSSDYIMAYVNPLLLATLDEEEGEVLEPTLVTAEDSPTLLVGGQSGGKPTSNDLLAGWELFRDRSATDVSLLMNSGYSYETETAYQNKMLEIAEYRRDCFCLFDIPMSQVEAEDAIDWRKNILGVTSYRAAVSSPWVKTYDSVQGRANFTMCPSAFVAKLIGAAGDPWNAPAGPNRGILSSSTVSPTGLTQYYDSSIGGTLYADNQINCIVRDAAAGYVNWGQRTLQAKPSALDRINVARTVIYIETILRDAARWHLFENNTPFERMQITLQFSSFLDTILSANGIAGYRVICDNSNNTPIVIANNQLVIDIIITPVYAAESIILNTTITGADASVDVSSSAN